MLEKELSAIVLDEIHDKNELDVVFDKVTEVTNTNRGKFNKINFNFFLTELEKKKAETSPVSQNQSITNTSTLRSKLPDLQLPTFDGKVTEWKGFWERFQSQLGSLNDLLDLQNLRI